MTSSEPTVRLATDDDLDEILDVCSKALGWTDPEFDGELFRWKHVTNAFGRSLLLVAADSTGIVAVRPFMRWRFGSGDTTITAARAVDTATRPDAQGRGLFRRLTEEGLERLGEDGTGFVFNTPNSKSLPGYLKMGWVEFGPVKLAYGLGSIASLPKIAKSRTAAAKRSIEIDHGVSVEDALANLRLGSARGSELTTDHTLETLRWRYASGPIRYRFLPSAGSTAGVIMRLRQRGVSRELLVADLVGNIESDEASRLVRDALSAVQADYVLAPVGLPRTVAIGRLGPTLALRSVNTTPAAESFRFRPGDIELF